MEHWNTGTLEHWNNRSETKNMNYRNSIDDFLIKSISPLMEFVLYLEKSHAE
jgi:hypothetical protein